MKAENPPDAKRPYIVVVSTMAEKYRQSEDDLHLDPFCDAITELGGYSLSKYVHFVLFRGSAEALFNEIAPHLNKPDDYGVFELGEDWCAWNEALTIYEKLTAHQET